MKSLLPILAAALVAASVPVRAQTSSPTATPAASAPREGVLHPGAVIDAGNATAYAKYLPAAARFAIEHGFRIKLDPTTRIQWSAGFQKETEKYSAQVGLDKDGFITNYVAGLPFPMITFTDPAAANKVAYNWHLGPVLPDDYSLSPWGSNGYASEKGEPTAIHPSGLDDQCEEFDFLRFAHRSEVDPRPAFPSNPEGIEWKAKCTKWSQTRFGGQGKGGNLWVRYLDPRQHDDSYGFNERNRRIRRMADEQAYRYPDQECRRCHQPYWAYALPKTEIYQYRLLGTAPILGCMNASDEPAGIDPSESKLTIEPFQIRNAYILEATPVDKGYSMRTLIYIDSEIYVWLAAEFYQGGQEVATAIPLWRMRAAQGGGNLFDLAGSFYVPTTRRNFFRSVVPANASFEQQINTGKLSERGFRPEVLELEAH